MIVVRRRVSSRRKKKNEKKFHPGISQVPVLPPRIELGSSASIFIFWKADIVTIWPWEPIR